MLVGTRCHRIFASLVTSLLLFSIIVRIVMIWLINEWHRLRMWLELMRVRLLMLMLLVRLLLWILLALRLLGHAIVLILLILSILVLISYHDFFHLANRYGTFYIDPLALNDMLLFQFEH